MAKDAKGHGSEKRGGSTFDRLNAMRKSEGYKPMPEKSRGVHDFLDYMDGSGPMPDAMVAAKLAAGNPKAGIPPVHSHFGTFAPTGSKAASHQASLSAKEFGQKKVQDAPYQKAYGMTRSQFFAKHEK